MKTLAENRAALAVSERTKRESQAFGTFFANHPELACVANANLLREHHFGEEVTLQSLEESSVYLGGLLSRKSHDEIAETRQHEAEQAEQARKNEKGNLIREILGRLKGAGLSVQAVELELKNRYRFFSVEELHAKLASMDEEKRLRALTHDELRREARANHSQAQAPELPGEYTPERIKRMPAPELRKLVGRYGNKVNERLGVQPAKRAGITFGVKI